MSSSIENNFIASLPNIVNKSTPTNDVSGYFNFGGSNLPNLTSQIGTALNSLFTQPQTYPATLAGFNAALLAAGYGGTTSGDGTNSNLFKNVVNVLTNSTSADDAALYSSLGISQNTIAINALNNFFQNLSPTELGGNPANYAANFASYLDKYLTTTTNINSSANNTIPSYEQLFVAFVGGNHASFQGKFTSFYNQMINTYGYFLPSQMLPQWIAQLSSGSNPTAVVNLGTGSEKTQIIFQLLALVSQMIDTLQDVSTAQVQRLSFYANWQQAYTTLISKIPVVTYSDLAGKVKTSGSSKTSDTNQSIIDATQAIGNINQTYTQTAQGFRDSVADESQSQQSAVDQSKQQLNAQSSLATTLLQNLNTILQSIFSH